MSFFTNLVGPKEANKCLGALGNEALPKDVLSVIFTECLDVKTQAICCRLSKKWNHIVQKNVNEIGLMVSVFNKSIPTFIGYDFYTRDRVIQQLMAEDPVVAGDFDGKHAMVFEGKIDENGSIVLKRKPIDRSLRAVVLEYDPLSKKDANASSEKNGDFAVQVVWKRVSTNFDANYSQSRYSEENPLEYDNHTHSVYRRANLEISYIAGSSSLAKTLDAVCKFLNDLPIFSIAASNWYFNLYQAQIWSKPLLETKEYTYI